MAGVRLGHESLRNTTYVIFHPYQKYKVPYICGKCNTTHKFKAYHLDLDDQGAVIVSHGVFNALRAVGLPGLRVLNEVEKPPPQHLSFGATEVVAALVSADDAKKSFGRLTVIKNKLIQPRSKPYG
jgi:hypothetical protein